MVFFISAIFKRTLLAAAMLLAGCTAPRPAVLAGPDPSDPGIAVPQPSLVSVTAGTGVAFPVPPLPWDAVNRRVTPGAAQMP